MSDKIKYKSMDSLNLMNNIINDAAKETNQPKKEIEEIDIKEITGAATGAGVGTAASVGLLGMLGTNGFNTAGITSALSTAGGLVGGGMAAGIGLIAAPIAILGIAGYAVSTKKKKKQLVEAKKKMLKEAVCKKNLIEEQLKNTVLIKKEKVEYLSALNISLKILITDLESDLSKCR